jgi:hypothetical protein
MATTDCWTLLLPVEDWSRGGAGGLSTTTTLLLLLEVVASG